MIYIHVGALQNLRHHRCALQIICMMTESELSRCLSYSSSLHYVGIVLIGVVRLCHLYFLAILDTIVSSNMYIHIHRPCVRYLKLKIIVVKRGQQNLQNLPKFKKCIIIRTYIRYIPIIVTVYGKTNLIPQTLILQYRAKRVSNRYLVDFEFIP